MSGNAHVDCPSEKAKGYIDLVQIKPVDVPPHLFTV